jgi:hypothetical protein
VSILSGTAAATDTLKTGYAHHLVTSTEQQAQFLEPENHHTCQYHLLQPQILLKGGESTGIHATLKKNMLLMIMPMMMKCGTTAIYDLLLRANWNTRLSTCMPSSTRQMSLHPTHCQVFTLFCLAISTSSVKNLHTLQAIPLHPGSLCIPHHSAIHAL